MASKEQQDTDPFMAMESLRAALAEVGITLPSLRLDLASPALNLVELGRVSSGVAVRLAEALQRGGRK
ncbi:hypothetical protein [Streptomyces sp. CAI 127]|uniref:hypothetical protein n=1 Tax=Streptomyces sp. CAI 127 TaxID=1076397 RepID=UPI00158736DE|nr:hypothetical protein [Streptomyces sp. CAI 127]NUW02030.1 hypothetical protein [Streptomyces sp. CAI 127]